jgi:hypothetical protein
VDIPDDQVNAALRALREEDQPELEHVLGLVSASLERHLELVPRALIEAVEAKWETDADIANGGADQLVWNHGAEAARTLARAFHEVGAIENAELIDRLASELEGYRHGLGPDAEATIAAQPVQHFLAYRRRVGGPFFAVPELDEELADALVEYAIEHRAALRDLPQ